MRLRLLDRLVLGDLLGPFLNGLLLFMLLVFTAGYLFQATDLLVQGVAFATVFRLILLSLPEVVTQTFPMSMLLAGLLGFGRLSADREAVAIFAAGVGFPRMARMVWIFGAVVSVIAFFWNDLVVPPTKRAYWTFKQEAIQHIKTSDKPLRFEIENADGHVELAVNIDGGYDAKARRVRRVTIIKYSQEGPRRGQAEAILYCRTAQPRDEKGLDWTYYDGWLLPLLPDRTTGQVDNTMPIIFREMKSSPRVPSLGKSFDDVLGGEVTDSSRLSFRQLQQEINAQREKGRDEKARGMEVDLYGKIALPMASLIFGIVGAALGLNTQRGGGRTVGFGVAIFIVFLYWVFYHAMFVVGKNGGLPPALASFLPDIVGIIVGIGLAMRASR